MRTKLPLHPDAVSSAAMRIARERGDAGPCVGDIRLAAEILEEAASHISSETIRKAASAEFEEYVGIERHQLVDSARKTERRIIAHLADQFGVRVLLSPPGDGRTVTDMPFSAVLEWGHLLDSTEMGDPGISRDAMWAAAEQSGRIADEDDDVFRHMTTDGRTARRLADDVRHGTQFAGGADDDGHRHR